jgi:riboflavin synthase
MFTGIVSGLGVVESVETGESGVRLRVRAGLAAELAPGDSVSVEGACLTATVAADGAFEADVMRQTLELTTLGRLRQGGAVNLELPLRATDRLGGHIVQGHVDGVAQVIAATEDGIARRLRLRLPSELMPYVVERGSVALAGVSLTVAALGEDWIEVSLIPETMERTTLGSAGEGSEVNLECDVLARYVRRLAPGV